MDNYKRRYPVYTDGVHGDKQELFALRQGGFEIEVI